MLVANNSRRTIFLKDMESYAATKKKNPRESDCEKKIYNESKCLKQEGKEKMKRHEKKTRRVKVRNVSIMDIFGHRKFKTVTW